ncbi:XRE family transcriptional regulator [Citricoccus alkalitolerans]|uniref:XRE family transcriptional regulator n=1 Tax=Citricoccus alkalitolerans TaxID=246603 RepID=A0ABV8Y2P7_9MICC
MTKFDQPSLFPEKVAALAFDPRRLTQARLLAGRTKQDVATSLGISGAALGQYEAGITTPRPDQLPKLADSLGVPLGFFTGGRPHAHLDASTAHFRSLRSTRVSQRAKAVTYVELLWELTYALEHYVELPYADLPDFGGEEQLSTPEAAARELRRHWGIVKGPFRHLIRTMEQHGIIVSMTSLGDEVARVDAFSTSHLPRPFVILTPDRADDVYRSRFTVAHELGHLVLHHDVAAGDVEKEKEADRFAAELLAPAAQIADELSTRIQLNALEEVSRRWGVSQKALVYRSRELGLVSDTSVRRAYQKLEQLRAAGILQNQPIRLFPGETPALLSKAFELAQEGGLTMERLAKQLSWTPSMVRTVLGEEDTRPKLRLI